MFREHPNGGGMTEIDFRNVEFFEDEFPSVREVKKDLKLYELQQDDPLSLSERENSHIHHVTKGSTLLVFRRNDENLVVQENQLENEIHPQSPIPENEVSPLIWDPTSPRDSGSDSLSIEDSMPLRETGRNSTVS